MCMCMCRCMCMCMCMYMYKCMYAYVYVYLGVKKENIKNIKDTSANRITKPNSNKPKTRIYKPQKHNNINII